MSRYVLMFLFGVYVCVLKQERMEVQQSLKSTSVSLMQLSHLSSKENFLVLCKPQLKELVIDLSNVEFCDSSGLSALLIAERKMRENGGTVKLVGVHKKVLSLIKISHLDRAFQILRHRHRKLRKVESHSNHLYTAIIWNRFFIRRLSVVAIYLIFLSPILHLQESMYFTSNLFNCGNFFDMKTQSRIAKKATEQKSDITDLDRQIRNYHRIPPARKKSLHNIR